MSIRFVWLSAYVIFTYFFLLCGLLRAALYAKTERNLLRLGGKGKERKGKEHLHEGMEKKMAFVGLEPTPSAIWAVVLSQLD